MIVTELGLNKKVFINEKKVLMVVPVKIDEDNEVTRILLEGDVTSDVAESFDEIMDKMGVDRC